MPSPGSTPIGLPTGSPAEVLTDALTEVLPIRPLFALTLRVLPVACTTELRETTCAQNGTRQSPRRRHAVHHLQNCGPLARGNPLAHRLPRPLHRREETK